MASARFRSQGLLRECRRSWGGLEKRSREGFGEAYLLGAPVSRREAASEIVPSWRAAVGLVGAIAVRMSFVFMPT